MKRIHKIVINLVLSAIIFLLIIQLSGYRVGVEGIKSELDKVNSFESYDYFESKSGEAFLIGKHSNGRTISFGLENEFGFRKIVSKQDTSNDEDDYKLSTSPSGLYDLLKFSNEELKLFTFNEEDFKFKEEIIDYDKYVFLNTYHNMYQIKTVDNRMAIIESGNFYFIDEKVNGVDDIKFEYTIPKNGVEHKVRSKNRILNDYMFIGSFSNSAYGARYDNLIYDEGFSMSTIVEYEEKLVPSGTYVINRDEIIFKRIGGIIIAQKSEIPEGQTEPFTTYKILHPLLADLLIELHDSV